METGSREQRRHQPARSNTNLRDQPSTRPRSSGIVLPLGTGLADSSDGRSHRYGGRRRQHGGTGVGTGTGAAVRAAPEAAAPHARWQRRHIRIAPQPAVEMSVTPSFYTYRALNASMAKAATAWADRIIRDIKPETTASRPRVCHRIRWSATSPVQTPGAPDTLRNGLQMLSLPMSPAQLANALRRPAVWAHNVLNTAPAITAPAPPIGFRAPAEVYPCRAATRAAAAAAVRQRHHGRGWPGGVRPPAPSRLPRPE